MDRWTHLRWTAKGLQIGSAIVGGGISLLILEPAAAWVKPFVTTLLWILAFSFVFELWYDIHVLSRELQVKHRSK